MAGVGVGVRKPVPPATPPTTSSTLGRPRRKIQKSTGGARSASQQSTRSIAATTKVPTQDSTVPKLAGPASIAAILNQHMQHVHTDNAISRLTSGAYDATSRTTREREFRALMKSVRDGPPGVGSDPISHDARRTILQQHRLQTVEYRHQLRLGEQATAEALSRTETILDDRLVRTSRFVRNLARQSNQLDDEEGEDACSLTLEQRELPDFPSDFSHVDFVEKPGNDVVRQAQAHAAFLQAGRRIVVQLRAARRLRYFREYGRVYAEQQLAKRGHPPYQSTYIGASTENDSDEEKADQFSVASADDRQRFLRKGSSAHEGEPATVKRTASLVSPHTGARVESTRTDSQWSETAAMSGVGTYYFPQMQSSGTSCTIAALENITPHLPPTPLAQMVLEVPSEYELLGYAPTPLQTLRHVAIRPSISAVLAASEQQRPSSHEEDESEEHDGDDDLLQHDV
eukprot:m.23100 g.23100  ORF g.23100 m.23100 type:complete len:457 (-) comp8452_c0_seq2:260-1630(-)